jgi:ribosomal protein L31E
LSLAWLCHSFTAWCDNSKGRAVFVSDSITVISIIKEVVTKEATAKRVAIEPQLGSSLLSSRRHRYHYHRMYINGMRRC